MEDKNLSSENQKRYWFVLKNYTNSQDSMQDLFLHNFISVQILLKVFTFFGSKD